MYGNCQSRRSNKSCVAKPHNKLVFLCNGSTLRSIEFVPLMHVCRISHQCCMNCLMYYRCVFIWWGWHGRRPQTSGTFSSLWYQHDDYGKGKHDGTRLFHAVRIKRDHEMNTACMYICMLKYMFPHSLMDFLGALKKKCWSMGTCYTNSKVI